MANISLLSRIVSGVQRQVDLSANTLVVSDLQINGINLRSVSSGVAGSTGIGDDNSYTNFTPASATVKGALSGIDTAIGTAAATGANKTLSNLTSPTSINQALIPDSTTNLRNLGLPTQKWNNLYLNGIGGDVFSTSPTIDFTSGIGVLRDSSQIASVDWANRQLALATTGNPVLGWSSAGIDLHTHKLLNVSSGTASTDGVNFGQVILAAGTNAWTANQSLGGFVITNSGTPVNPGDLVNKIYVDNFINATSWKTAALVATTANITLSGEQTIDGVLTSTSRVLVKNQTTASQNGIYVTASGAWTRSVDMNVWTEVPAAAVFVESGTLNADLGYVCTAQPGGTLGTTAINFVQFSSAGAYTADNVTLQLISGVFSVKTNGIALSNLAQLPTNTLIGNNTGGTANAAALTTTQVTAMLNVFTSSLQGLVPASGGGTANFLRADGTWAAPTGSVTSVALSVPATSIFGVTGSPITGAGTLGLTTTGTSGGIPYFSSTSALSSSALLVANAIVLGGGAGAAPSTLGSLGTVNTVLHGNASGAPTFSAVVAADMSSGASAAGAVATADGSGGVSYVSIPDPANLPFTAGVSFAANTSFAVRLAIQTSTETISTVYKADNVASSVDNFWVIGMAKSATSVVAGGAITVKISGLYTLGSADTLFNTTDIGKPVYLGTSGAFTVTPPTASQISVFKIGIVYSTTQIMIIPQHIGVN